MATPSAGVVVAGDSSASGSGSASSAVVVASVNNSSASSSSAGGVAPPKLLLYPVLDGFIGQLKLTKAHCRAIDEARDQPPPAAASIADPVKGDGDGVQTIVLVDRSMSMGRETKRLMTEVFPAFLERIHGAAPAAAGPQEEPKLTVIGFDDEATFLQLTADELKKSDLRARGGTVLSSALNLLTDYVERSNPDLKKKKEDQEQEEKKNADNANDKKDEAEQPLSGLTRIANAALSLFPSSSSSSSSDSLKPLGKKSKVNQFCPFDDPLRAPPPPLGPQDTLNIDVCFIMDCTGSMGGWIDQARKSIFDLVKQVRTECETVRDNAPTRIRLSFVAYRDYFDRARFDALDFTTDVDAFHQFVSRQPADGGGDGPEDLLGGLDLALKQSWSPDAHTRIALLVADAPCHGCATDSEESKKFADPLLPIDVQEQLVRAFQEKRIALSFTRIAEYTDEMMARFQSYYYLAGSPRKSIKVLQLGQKVERFLPSVLSMISSAAAQASASGGSGPVEGCVPKEATPMAHRVRLLTISDGELEDMHATVQTAERLAELLKDRYVVNSQAVRFFTSDDQPDTRGLSSTLQLNSLLPAQLLDIKAPDVTSEQIVDQLVALFEDDGMERKIVLECQADEAAREESKEESKSASSSSSSSSSSSVILQSAPWSAPQSSLSLVSGENTFWLRRAPSSSAVVINGHLRCEVEVVHDALNQETYGLVLARKIAFFMHQLKVLKVVDSQASKETIAAITEYFTKLEAFLHTAHAQAVVQATGGSGTGLRVRMAALQSQLSKKQTSIAMRMREVANDDRIAKLNSMQAAEYLRSAFSSKTSKAIARRAESAGFEFDQVVQKELVQMAQHIDELADLDDADHARSFYSMETTLGGIRTLCELTRDMEARFQLEDVTVHDVLPLLNLVGVACSAPIGDFPDAMTYRVDEVFLGTTVSVSDILQAHIAGHGEKLKPIGGGVHEGGAAGAAGGEMSVTNCIPFFEDARIHHFLRRHAPSLLEYTASVGMRRMVTGVPMTFTYTIAAGVWKMVDALDRNRSAIHCERFAKLLETFEVAVGKHFAHVYPLMTRAPTKDAVTGQQLSFWIANNGITNMISPLLHQIRSDTQADPPVATPNLPEILRALYAFEVRQAMKRFMKRRCPPEEKDKLDLFSIRMLNCLLGLRADSPHKTPLPAMFASRPPTPNFWNEVGDDSIDEALLDEMIQGFWYLDHVCHLPAFIRASCSAKPVEAFAAIPPLSDDYCTGVLGLEEKTSLRRFKLHMIIQSILYPAKADRVDSDRACMKIVDLRGGPASEKILSDLVAKYYTDLYASEMAARKREERALVCAELVGAMCATESLGTFKSLFTHGLTKGQTKLKVENSSAYGFQELKNGLLNRSDTVPMRLEKVAILMLGTDRYEMKDVDQAKAPASAAAEEEDEKKEKEEEKKKAPGSYASAVKTSAATSSTGSGSKLTSGTVIVGTPIWNAGHSLFIGDIAPYDAAFLDTADASAWAALKHLHLTTYQHLYRSSGAPNRHGHHQGKMSYWARGFATIDKLEAAMAKEEWEEYKAVHTNCCGLGPKIKKEKEKKKKV